MARSPGTPSALRLLPLLWARLSCRHWRRSPRQALLLSLTVAVGVGVAVSVRLANRAAVANFGAFAGAVTGRGDLVLTSPAGQLPDSALADARALLGSRPVDLVPVVEAHARRVETPSKRAGPGEARGGAGGPALAPGSYQLLGVDLVAALNRTEIPPAAEAGADGSEDRLAAVGRVGRALVSRRMAAANGLGVGGVITVLVDDRTQPLEIVGLLPDDPVAPAPDNLIVMDLPALRTLTGRAGQVDRVEVRVEDGPGLEERRTETAALLRRGAAGRWDVEEPSARRRTGEVMTRAFRLNLAVLSLIALLVGLFLVAQALDAAVVKRREEIAVLRSLGVTPGVIQASWFVEAAVIGVAGGILGLLLGWGGAQFAVTAVARTVDALYLASSAREAAFRPGDALFGLGLGLGASLLAGWIPAREAARTPPAQALTRGFIDPGPALLRHPWVGLVLIAAGAVTYHLPPLQLGGGVRFPLAGYATAFLWVIGGGLLAAPVLRLLAATARPLGRYSAPLRVALGRLRSGSGRHRLAAAGLVVAVAMAAGMAIMIHSFERTMTAWIEDALHADLYVASAGSSGAVSRHRMAPETWTDLALDPAVAVAEEALVRAVSLDGVGTYLVGGQLEPQARTILWLDPPEPGTRLLPGNSAVEPALVSESFADRFKVGKGSVLAVPTPSGPKSVAVAGVYLEYGNEQGSLLVDRSILAGWFDDPRASRLSVLLKPGQDAGEVRRRWLEQHPGIKVRTQRHLREEILQTFRQTFAITYALQAIGVVVAVAGIGLGLVCLALENRRDFTTLRALGMTRHALARATAAEGAGLAAAGTAAGLALSLALGHLLVYVINKQSFGWTLAFDLPLGQLGAFALTLLAAAAATAYAVGRWAADLPADRVE